MIKIIIFILIAIPSIALSNENICDWIISEGGYQEYLNDLPSSNFNSAFHVAAGTDGRCSYGWDWDTPPETLEDIVKTSFNDCEKDRKKKNLDRECQPYDINTKIVWGNPQLFEELVGSKIKTYKEMIVGSSEKVCEWIISDGRYQEYLDKLPSSDFNSAFHVVVDNTGGCTYASWWSKSNIIGLKKTIQRSFHECVKWSKEYNIDGECKPYDVNKKIVWNNPDAVKELITFSESKEDSKELVTLSKSKSEEFELVCKSIDKSQMYLDYLDNMKQYPDDKHVFWVIRSDVDDSKCDQHTYRWWEDKKGDFLDIVKKTYLGCTKDKVQAMEGVREYDKKGECIPFALNRSIVWKNP